MLNVIRPLNRYKELIAAALIVCFLGGCGEKNMTKAASSFETSERETGSYGTEIPVVIQRGMEVADLKKSADEILLDSPTCCIMKMSFTIAVVGTNGTTVENWALFDRDTGDLLRCNGIDLVPLSIELTTIVGSKTKHVTEMLAATEFDLGSGRYIPAYLSENAKLIILECDSGIVRGVCVTNLIDNAVQQYGESAGICLSPST